MIVSEKIKFVNERGKRIICVCYHLKGDVFREPVIVIVPDENETESDSIILSHYFVKKGYLVFCYEVEKGEINEYDEEELLNQKDDLDSVLDFIKKQFKVNLFGIVISSTKKEVELALSSITNSVKSKFILNREYYLEKAKNSIIDKRNFVRLVKDIQVKFSFSNEENWNRQLSNVYDATGKNISEGGMVIEVNYTGENSLNLLSLKSIIDLEIDLLPVISQKIKTNARVKWIKKGFSEDVIVFGVEFFGISKENKEKINHYISEELKIQTNKHTGGLFLEKRKAPRKSVNFPARINIDPYNSRNLPQTTYGRVVEISETGLCFSSDVFLPKSLFVNLILDLPYSSVEIQAQVVWSKHSDVYGNYFSGLHFLGAEAKHLKIIRKIIEELKKERKRKFAFISNYRDGSDQFRPHITTKLLPHNLDLKTLKHNVGYAIASYFDVYGKVEGYSVFLLITAEDMLNLPIRAVREKILKAVLFAQNELEVNYIGLGSYTKSFTDGGLWLSLQPEVTANLTHGDSLTSWMAIEGTKEKLGLNFKNMKIAVVGAYGLIGRTISRLLVREEPEKLILVGRNKNKLNQLEEIIRKENKDINSELMFTQEISNVKEADLIFTVTSSPTAILKEEYLKEGVIIYDLAQPINVPPEICNRRPDILRIDGGFVKIPQIDIKTDMGPPKGTIFACFAELILQCLEDKKGKFVGPIELSWVEQVRDWSKKYNFSHADLTCFSFPLTDGHIKNITTKHALREKLGDLAITSD